MSAAEADVFGADADVYDSDAEMEGSAKKSKVRRLSKGFKELVWGSRA